MRAVSSIPFLVQPEGLRLHFPLMDDSPCGMVEIPTEMLNILLNPFTTRFSALLICSYLYPQGKNALHPLILDSVFLYPKSKMDANCFADWMSIVLLCFCTEFSLISCQCRNHVGATQMGREDVRFAKLASPISTNSNAKGRPRPPFFSRRMGPNVVLWGSLGMQGRFQVVWERRFQLKFVEG